MVIVAVLKFHDLTTECESPLYDTSRTLRTPNRPVFGFRELSMEKRMLRPSGITKLHAQWFWDMVASSSSLPGGERPRVKASSLAEIILLSRRGSGRFSTKCEDIFEFDLVKVVWFMVYTVMLTVLFLCCLCCQYSLYRSSALIGSDWVGLELDSTSSALDWTEACRGLDRWWLELLELQRRYLIWQ